MFCPRCKAEYRPGFTRCADCDVDLVEGLPDAETVASRGSRDGSFLVPLWNGEDPALHDKLIDSLKEGSIPFYEKNVGDYPGVRRADPLLLYSRPRFGFEVTVFSSDLRAAQEILEKLLDEEPEELALPVNDSEGGGQESGKAEDSAEDVTCEVWSGAETRQTSFLRDALRENEISFRSTESGPDVRLLVRPADESAAREIIREIVDAAPPV